MQKDFIQELQPLFCSRASLLQAQNKLNDNPNMDCQMRLRFADGSEVVLNIRRTDIENIITESVGNIETSINNTLTEIATEES